MLWPPLARARPCGGQATELDVLRDRTAGRFIEADRLDLTSFIPERSVTTVGTASSSMNPFAPETSTR